MDMAQGELGEQGGPEAKRGPGHPLEYDREALVPVICEQLSEGVPLRVICRQEGMPSAGQVHAWKKADPSIAEPIERARDLGHDAIAERLRLTARGKGPDEGGDSTGDVARDTLIVNTDLKLLAKWSPRYAERLAHTNKDGTGDAVLRIETSLLADELTHLINITPRDVIEALPPPTRGPSGTEG